jgi:hypothetical protein
MTEKDENDPFFIPPGAEAFKADLPKAQIHFFETGHFVLETHFKEIGAKIDEFLASLDLYNCIFYNYIK